MTKGAGSRAAGLAMAFKLIESAQQRCRAVNGPHLVALIRAGATFEKELIRLGQGGGDDRRFPGLDTSDTCHNGAATRRPGQHR
jgi:hypothetical protein